MFRYSLNELLNDKELCKKVITKKLYLYDGGGDFKTLDFENNSMRHNHIKAFEQLYKIGGKKLFDAILSDGKTCLSDNPDAAKVGVIAIQGADGYYLKSNVSAIVAFMSILNALKHIGVASELFDMDDIYVEYEDIREEILADVSEEDMEYMEKLDRIHSGEEPYENEESEDFEECESTSEYEVCSPRKLSIVKHNDLYRLFDDDVQQFVDFECKSGDETVCVSHMYDIQPLIHIENVGVEIEDDQEKPVTEEHIKGYRYQIEKDGKWGYISANFIRFVYPVYEGIVVTKNGKVMAWIEEDDSYISVCAAGYYSYESPEGFVENEYSLSEIPRHFDREQDTHWFCMLNKHDDIPRENSIYEENWTGEVTLYIPVSSMKNAIFKIAQTDEKNIWGEYPSFQYVVHYFEGFLHLHRIAEHGVVSKKVPAKGLDINSCTDAHKYNSSCGYEYVSYVCDDIYVLQKEGYFAVAQIDFKNGYKINNYITPFAFTKIDVMSKIDGNVFIVDRFGKKGVYDLEAKKYVVPCEYEKINLTIWGYLVYKAGFQGEINTKGEWIQRLKREE